MKVLLIDNYDSFTFNLYQLVGDILQASEGSTVEVKRNDAVTLAEIKSGNYDRIIISPGPGNPSDEKYFGVCSLVIRDLGQSIPILGVCLGMQGIGYVFGGKIVRAPEPRHGKTSSVTHSGTGLFAGLPQGIEVMRYHSLVVEENDLPECLEIIATATDMERKIIMGLKHKKYPIVGVQFHPESFMTEGGRKMLQNFLYESIA